MNAAVNGLNVELFNLASDPNEKTKLVAQAVPPKSAPMEVGDKTPRVWDQAD